MDATLSEPLRDPAGQATTEPGAELARDHVAQTYLGLRGQPGTQERLRDRVHWMAGQTQGPAVLDIGCSEGILALLLAREGLQVVGIDINPEAIAYGNSLLAQEEAFIRSRVTFLNGDILSTPLQQDLFDTVVLGEVIEHLVLPERLLDFALSRVRPGGRLIVTTPFGIHPDPDHRQTFTLSRFVQLLQPRCQLGSLAVVNGYIRFTGTRPAAGDQNQDACARSWASLDPQALHAITETGLLGVQNRLYGDLERRSNQVETLKGSVTLLTRRLERTQRELQQQQNETSRAQAELKRLQTENLSWKKEISHREQEIQQLKTHLTQARNTVNTLRRHEAGARHQLERVMSGPRYRVGSLVAVVTRPLRALLRRPAQMLRGKKVASVIKRSALPAVAAASSVAGTLKTPLTGVLSKPRASAKTAPPAVVAFDPFPAPPAPDVNSNLPTIATLLDPFSEACLRYEAHLVPVTQNGWREEILAARPAFFLAESAKSGNDGAWTGALTQGESRAGEALRSLLAFCKEQKIPTVFWNTADPLEFDAFIEAARCFDVIFTCDADSIPRYQSACGHQRVYVLPFAAQPMIHNPMRWKGLRPYDICFAGSWNQKTPSRAAALPMLLDPALERGGLHIFDRMQDQASEASRFPQKYQPAIQGTLDYDRMLNAYRAYRVFLNANSVETSPSAFSRRVLEVLASGTPVISNPSAGMETMLGTHVRVSRSADETRRHLKSLLDNELERQRQAHLAYRYVHTHHTYRQRFATLCSALALPAPAAESPLMSVIACTNRPQNLEILLASYSCQTHANRELVLVLNSDRFDMAAVQARTAGLPAVRIFSLPESETLGDCLNFGIGQSRGTYWAKMDDDDHYGPGYLSDSLLALNFSGADVVGKHTFFTYIEGLNQLFIRTPGCEHRFDPSIAGASLVAWRDAWERVKFIPRTGGGDTIWLRECVAQGMRIYSCDKYNFIVVRHQDLSRHTWKIEQDAFMVRCLHVADGFDPAPAMF